MPAIHPYTFTVGTWQKRPDGTFGYILTQYHAPSVQEANVSWAIFHADIAYGPDGKPAKRSPRGSPRSLRAALGGGAVFAEDAGL